MYIPDFVTENFSLQSLMDGSSDALCPAAIAEALTGGLEKRDAASTYNRARTGWNRCMDRRWCKIVAIVCIVVGSLIVLWVISLLVNVICCGLSCCRAMCWCCPSCGGRSRGRNREVSAPPPPPPQQQPYESPNMYYQPQTVPNRQQQQKEYFYA